MSARVAQGCRNSRTEVTLEGRGEMPFGSHSVAEGRLAEGTHVKCV